MPRDYIPNIVESAQGANTHFNRVFDLLKTKRAKEGLSNQEISIITAVSYTHLTMTTKRIV